MQTFRVTVDLLDRDLRVVQQEIVVVEALDWNRSRSAATMKLRRDKPDLLVKAPYTQPTLVEELVDGKYVEIDAPIKVVKKKVSKK
jgi:hypothetical protein